MTRQRQTTAVQTGVVETSQQRQGGANVLQGTGPATAVVTEPAVFDVPDCEAGGGQRRGQGPSMVDAVGVEPAAAVNEHHHRVATGRQPQFGELRGGLAVAQHRVGRTVGQGLYLAETDFPGDDGILHGPCSEGSQTHRYRGGSAAQASSFHGHPTHHFGAMIPPVTRPSLPISAALCYPAPYYPRPPGTLESST